MTCCTMLSVCVCVCVHCRAADIAIEFKYLQITWLHVVWDIFDQGSGAGYLLART